MATIALSIILQEDSAEILYDIPELPVIHNSTSLALMIMREANCGADCTNHRNSPSDIIGRAWQYAVIYNYILHETLTVLYNLNNQWLCYNLYIL